ncbi:hypothetical protein [Oceanobacillus manasiensis]|uniref:hypothetical protein n=1 Tax=Oceanobacillus manasiensis TaxID=586413 RepID=UPI0005AAE5A6|nr:hypothetical protein [Oceanobacillus manasiensis]
MGLKGEKGAALVLTLLIITLILLFITTLSGQVIQTTKQITTVEKRTDAELVAQMGIDYVQAVLDMYTYNEEQNALEYLQERLEGTLSISSLEHPEVILGDGRRFEINLPDPPAKVEDGLEVEYKIYGTAQGQTVRTDDTITINKE